jgi:hypothetical protein
MITQEEKKGAEAISKRAIEHFVALARRGRGQGASGGERRAARLANAILENVPGMDGDAIVGVGLFAQLTSAQYELACQLIDSKPSAR